MHRIEGSLFFERSDDGAVRIVKTADGQRPWGHGWRGVGHGETRKPHVFDITLTPSEWANLVTSVSSTGDT